MTTASATSSGIKMQTEEITFEWKKELTKDIRFYCFVCTGNTCRSPMAAAVLNHYGAPHGIFAFSRGIAADVGAPISENAVKALEAAGIPAGGRNDYKSHRAVQFCEEDFADCSGVFAISPRHAEALTLAFPKYAGKIRTLGEIADPFGGDEAAYRACLADIIAAVREAFPFIFPHED